MTIYQRFLLQTGTALHDMDDTFAFAVAPNRDLFAIKKSNTGTNSTEVHILSAAIKRSYQMSTIIQPVIQPGGNNATSFS